MEVALGADGALESVVVLRMDRDAARRIVDTLTAVTAAVNAELTGESEDSQPLPPISAEMDEVIRAAHKRAVAIRGEDAVVAVVDVAWVLGD